MKLLFFRAGLAIFIFSFAVVTLADTGNGPRERVSFNAGWRFVKGDPTEVTNQLAYTNIQDWVDATGAEFTRNAELAAKTRPAGNPGGDISFAQTGFNDSQWRLLNLPHDWGIEGPFKQEYPGETGKLPWWGVGVVSQASGDSRDPTRAKKCIWRWTAQWLTRRSG